jgi:hypothetical protein
MTLRAMGWLGHVTTMKRWIFSGLIALAGLMVSARAQEKFSQAMRPEDFAASGLAKLTPEERARLDGFIEAYKSGAVVSAETSKLAEKLATAQRATEVAAAARVVAEERAIKAERAAEEAKAANVAAAKQKEKEKPKAEGGGFLARAKVLLKPGTEVEYERVETRLLGDFRGWRDGTVFVLENGQSWQVQGGSYSTPPEPGPRKVVIAPGLLGGFFLEIEGVRQKPKIKFVGGGK